MAATNNMNRAERFEDEKRRIIESCFTKKDEDGSGEPIHCASATAPKSLLETNVSMFRPLKYSRRI